MVAQRHDTVLPNSEIVGRERLQNDSDMQSLVVAYALYMLPRDTKFGNSASSRIINIFR